MRGRQLRSVAARSTAVVVPVTLLCAGALASTTGPALFPLGIVVLVGAVMAPRRGHGLGPWPAVMLPMAGLLILTTVQRSPVHVLAIVLVVAGAPMAVTSRIVAQPRIAGALLLAGALLVAAAGLPGAPATDVAASHAAAADRVMDGQSPYRNLGVTESSPFTYGAPIEGYSYPPIVLVVQALGGRLLGGARIVTAMLWVALVALALKRYGTASAVPALIAVVPGLALSVEIAWTEPLTALLVLAGLTLRSGGGRAGALGAALASKQYMVVAAPALAVAWWRRYPSRMWIVAGTAVVVTLPVLLDATGAFHALVTFQLDRAVRPDSTNLAGWFAARGRSTWVVPSWLVLIVSAVAGGVMARAPHPTAWVDGMVVALVMTLVIGPVALPNYWILITVLLLVAVAERQPASG